MFDIAFSELVVIMVVALIVIGPERLPKVARTAGNLWGRMQRYVQGIKNDIANDLTIEEAKRLRNDVGKEIEAFEQATLEARVALKRKILEAQMGEAGKTPGEPQPPAQV